VEISGPIFKTALSFPSEKRARLLGSASHHIRSPFRYPAGGSSQGPINYHKSRVCQSIFLIQNCILDATSESHGRLYRWRNQFNHTVNDQTQRPPGTGLRLQQSRLKVSRTVRLLSGAAIRCSALVIQLSLHMLRHSNSSTGTRCSCLYPNGTGLLT